jgi:proliferating cell nuclear antigen
MHLKTIQASALKTCFEVLKDVLHDVNLFFTSTGITITALDNAKVALINMRLCAENFEEYSCVQPVTAGVNISNLFKLFKIITTSDVLDIDITGKDIMNITIENATKNSKTKFDYKLLWINEDVLSIPDVERQSTTILPSVDFQRICRDMGNLSEDVKIIRDHNLVRFSCNGDFANQTTNIDTEQDDFEGVVGNTYPLKYINLFTKATSMCSTMKIHISEPTETIPIIFVYNIANLGEIEFFLAARSDD